MPWKEANMSFNHESIFCTGQAKSLEVEHYIQVKLGKSDR
jgi:hypothetical protein